MSDKLELADVFYRHGDHFCQKQRISPQQLKVFNMIKICRTSALGGHLEQCDSCGYQRPVYNSCRNRHCPKCQSFAKEKWLNGRRAELLPCGYFHLVFTLPHEFNALIMGNKQQMLSLLFKSTAEVLRCFAKDPQWRLEGRMGFIGVLHTWSQTLLDHFHLHCLVPAGVLAFDEASWINARKKYLFKTQALAKAFKRRYLQLFVDTYKAEKLKFAGRTATFADPNQFGRLIHDLRKKIWIVYAKRPFAGPDQVLEYLGRYTHRVAISNNRIVAIQNGAVSFTYRDRADGNIEKLMTLEATEFIRRFLLHVLPDGFVKIRYFGFLAHRNKKRCIALIRTLINPLAPTIQILTETPIEMIRRLTGIDMTCCPHCGKGKMMVTMPLFKIATAI
jgi:hypothetical protein